MASKNKFKSPAELVRHTWDSTEWLLPKEASEEYRKGWVLPVPHTCTVIEHRRPRRRGSLRHNFMSRYIIGEPPEGYTIHARRACVGRVAEDESYLDYLRSLNESLPRMPRQLTIVDKQYLPQDPVDGRQTPIRNTIANFTIRTFAERSGQLHAPGIQFSFLRNLSGSDEGSSLAVSTIKVTDLGDDRAVRDFLAEKKFDGLPSAADADQVVNLFNICRTDAEVSEMASRFMPPV